MSTPRPLLVPCVCHTLRLRTSFQGMERRDLIAKNVPIMAEHGKEIAECASKSVRVLVVANPACTNCLVVSKCRADRGYGVKLAAKEGPSVTVCDSGLRSQIPNKVVIVIVGETDLRSRTPCGLHDYDTVVYCTVTSWFGAIFLRKNIDSLVMASCSKLGRPKRRSYPLSRDVLVHGFSHTNQSSGLYSRVGHTLADSG